MHSAWIPMITACLYLIIMVWMKTASCFRSHSSKGSQILRNPDQNYTILWTHHCVFSDSSQRRGTNYNKVKWLSVQSENMQTRCLTALTERTQGSGEVSSSHRTGNMCARVTLRLSTSNTRSGQRHQPLGDHQKAVSNDKELSVLKAILSLSHFLPPSCTRGPRAPDAVWYTWARWVTVCVCARTVSVSSPGAQGGVTETMYREHSRENEYRHFSTGIREPCCT